MTFLTSAWTMASVHVGRRRGGVEVVGRAAGEVGERDRAGGAGGVIDAGVLGDGVVLAGRAELVAEVLHVGRVAAGERAPEDQDHVRVADDLSAVVVDEVSAAGAWPASLFTLPWPLPLVDFIVAVALSERRGRERCCKNKDQSLFHVLGPSP